MGFTKGNVRYACLFLITYRITYKGHYYSGVVTGKDNSYSILDLRPRWESRT
jgi:hypothetical protein